MKGRKGHWWTLAACVVVVVVFAVKAWQRRWLCDDGLIVFRVVEQIHAGNGPVFNVLERTEPATSTLWTWLLAGLYSVYPGQLEHLAVNVSLICAVLAMIVGLDAARRLVRGAGVSHVLVPAGALVLVAVYSFWDFSTSGLETSMTWLWCAMGWWLLVTLEASASTRRQLATVVVLGLGPLVRPDYAIVSAVYLVTASLLLRPTRRRTLALLAAALALPVAYQIFRMGYYGILVPLPALAKSAGSSAWGRGADYVWDLLRPCFVYIPLAILATTLGVVVARRGLGSREKILVLAPMIAGALVTLYIVRVGGDFMHGRMVLGPVLLFVLPGFVLPARGGFLLPIGLLVVWAVIVGPYRDDNKTHSGTGIATVWDERIATRRHTRSARPLNRRVFVRAMQPVTGTIAMAVLAGQPLLITESGIPYPFQGDAPASLAFVVGRLGAGGASLPLYGFVVDMLGLANPIGARIPATNSGYPGHEKPLPLYWALAELADPAQPLPWITDPEIAEMRAGYRALHCGALRELVESVRAPMTPSRFWANLTGAFARTRLTVPLSGIEAERQFCGDSAAPH